MRLLLAEDNRELAHWLEKALVQGGFAVDCVADGRAADHLLQSEQYALAVLDIGMPGYDGLEVVQRLRKRGQTLPVLLLTARSAVADRVKGLNAGADDYLPKPFELEELDARLRALLRRSEGQVHEVQQLGELAYCDEGYFLLRGQMLSLTPRELALLKVLMFHPPGFAPAVIRTGVQSQRRRQSGKHRTLYSPSAQETSGEQCAYNHPARVRLSA